LVTVTSKLPPVYPVVTAADVAQVTLFATTFAWFVAASPVPVTCTTQDAVIGQLFVIVNGPFNLNEPTSKEKSSIALGL
jgi:hypothetical protein